MRSVFLYKALENILNFKSIVQSITVVEQIIQTISFDQHELIYDAEESKNNPAPAKQIMSMLQDKVHIIDSLVNSIASYHAQVKQKCK